MKKPKVGDYYKNRLGNAFKVLSVNDFLGFAVVEWVGEDFGRTWNYLVFPEPIEHKLTSLEIELL